MKKDIETTEDITTLVNAFYTKVIDDETIGFIFKMEENFSFETHIPVMISFWETLLLGAGTYSGNPILKHIELNKKVPLTNEHFTHWLHLWETTVQELFEGKVANEAISKARNIERLMQFKIQSTSIP